MNPEEKTILLVEDDTDIRMVYAEVLRDAGFKVVEAKDGDIGLKRAFSDEWDLMLLDIMLPGEDGMKILKHIKSNDKHKAKPVILLTNLDSPSIINEGFNLGADGYLIKSEITPDKILEEVNVYFKK
jgi:DNA-binding response OmpR family regulator